MIIQASPFFHTLLALGDHWIFEGICTTLTPLSRASQGWHGRQTPHATVSKFRANANTDVINNPHFTDIKEDIWLIPLQYNRFFAEIDPGFVISTNIQTDKLAKVSKTLGISTFQHKIFLGKA